MITKTKEIKVIYNERGNPVYNNIEFFECFSKDYSMSLEKEDHTYNADIFK